MQAALREDARLMQENATQLVADAAALLAENQAGGTAAQKQSKAEKAADNTIRSSSISTFVATVLKVAAVSDVAQFAPGSDLYAEFKTVIDDIDEGSVYTIGLSFVRSQRPLPIFETLSPKRGIGNWP